MTAKILIADDDPVCRTLLETTLAMSGHPLLLAGDGDEAWKLIEESEGPLLAVLDWHMPGIDGLELCQRLRETHGERPVHTILVTGRTGRDSVIRGLDAGAHDYVTKPFDHEELHARIQVGLRVLRLQEALAERVHDLEEALANVKHLQGLLPICCYCKSIRTDQDYWQQVEHYLAEHSEVRFSHGICPQCYAKVVEPQLNELQRKKKGPASE